MVNSEIKCWGEKTQLYAIIQDTKRLILCKSYFMFAGSCFGI